MSKKAEKTAEAKKGPGIGDIAVAAIAEGKTNEEALAAVKKAFPDAKTGMASINWYRNKMRADGAKLKGSGKPIPTSRELAAKTAKATPTAAAKKPATKKTDAKKTDAKKTGSATPDPLA